MRYHFSLFPVLAVILSANELPSQQAVRVESLENALLAPCCYSEPVSRHRSEVALQMRAEIAQWVVEGKSDREIIDTYKQRYGARVLVEPQGFLWWWMHVIPWIATLVGLAFTIWIMRRMRAPANTTP